MPLFKDYFKIADQWSTRFIVGAMRDRAWIERVVVTEVEGQTPRRLTGQEKYYEEFRLNDHVTEAIPMTDVRTTLYSCNVETFNYLTPIIYLSFYRKVID